METPNEKRMKADFSEKTGRNLGIDEILLINYIAESVGKRVDPVLERVDKTNESVRNGINVTAMMSDYKVALAFNGWKYLIVIASIVFASFICYFVYQHQQYKASLAFFNSSSHLKAFKPFFEYSKAKVITSGDSYFLELEIIKQKMGDDLPSAKYGKQCILLSDKKTVYVPLGRIEPDSTDK